MITEQSRSNGRIIGENIGHTRSTKSRFHMQILIPQLPPEAGSVVGIDSTLLGGTVNGIRRDGMRNDGNSASLLRNPLPNTTADSIIKPVENTGPPRKSKFTGGFGKYYTGLAREQYKRNNSTAAGAGGSRQGGGRELPPSAGGDFPPVPDDDNRNQPGGGESGERFTYRKSVTTRQGKTQITIQTWQNGDFVGEMTAEINSDGVAELQNVRVEDDFRRQGHATDLYRRILEIAQQNGATGFDSREGIDSEHIVEINSRLFNNNHYFDGKGRPINEATAKKLIRQHKRVDWKTYDQGEPGQSVGEDPQSKKPTKRNTKNKQPENTGGEEKTRGKGKGFFGDASEVTPWPSREETTGGESELKDEDKPKDNRSGWQKFKDSFSER